MLAPYRHDTNIAAISNDYAGAMPVAASRGYYIIGLLCYTIAMETMLGIGDGPHWYSNSPALIGDEEGGLHRAEISPNAMHLVNRFYAEPRYVKSLIVRLPTVRYPTPDYGLSIHPPIDIDAMIQGAVERQKKVTAYTAMPTITFRELRLEGYRVGVRLIVYCVFDCVDRVWYVHRRYF